MSSFKKVSLKDIAEASKVSTALVSFVLNDKKKEYRVGEETAKRILQIAKEMNYQPNIAAKSLRSGRTKTIGAVISDISNPFFSQLARLLEDEATKRGYTVLFGSSDEDTEKMNRVVSDLINRGVDGLIIVPCENSEKSIASWVENNVPIVLFDRYFPEINVSYVALNNFNATYTATKYLLDSGYNAPCMVAYDVNLIHMKERIRGYKKAMNDAGKKRMINVALLKQNALTLRKSVDRLLPKIIEGGADAFLFATNMISIACLYVIKDLGQEVVSKIGIVGFDGSPIFDFFSTPVSYMQQPAEVLVQKALEILIENIVNGNTVQSVLAEGVFIKMTS
jgi:LacI family transcriptional regulator